MMLEHHGLSVAFNTIPTDKPLKILDIGAGYGFWGFILKSMLKHEPTITAIEISSSHVDRLKRLNFYEKIIEGDATEIDFSKMDNYDVALLSHVVEHIEKEKAIHLLKSLMKTCEQIIILCPEGNALSEIGINGASHLSIWIERDLQRLGFTTQHIRFSHRAGRAAVLFEKVWFWLRRIKRGGVITAWWNRENDIP